MIQNRDGSFNPIQELSTIEQKENFTKNISDAIENENIKAVFFGTKEELEEKKNNYGKSLTEQLMELKDRMDYMDKKANSIIKIANPNDIVRFAPTKPI